MISERYEYGIYIGNIKAADCLVQKVFKKLRKGGLR